MEAGPKPQRQRRRRKLSETKVDVKVTDINLDAKPKTKKRKRNRRRVRRPVFGPWLPGQGPPRRGALRRAVKREIKREGLDGPRVSVQQRVSSTFGLVGPNKSGNVELELNFFLHPSLAKEANDGTSFGPVQALAAQYALWKLKYLRLVFTPMVGASAVSGTVVRASLNLSQSPGGTNWSGLGTRIHLDLHPGQTAVFHLRGDQIGGPRDGGWWLTDTNEEGSQSAGPIVEVHTLGKTESTFKAEPWDSPLFIVEGIGVWQFANYQVKPALGMLERRQETVSVEISADANEPITMDLPLTSTVAQFMMDAEPETHAVTSTQSVGETIFQIVDVGADLAKTYAPPPFSWLISGGWWFLKRVFGKNREGKATFNVYPSLADAQNDRPAIAGPTSVSVMSPVNAEIMVTQINAPNVGPQPTASAFVRAAVPIPMSFGTFRMHTEMFPMELVAWGPVSEPTNTDFYPSSYIIGNFHKKNTGDSKSYLKTAWWVAPDNGQGQTMAYPPSPASGAYIHTMYRLHNTRFSSLDGNSEYIPPQPKSGVALYFGGSRSDTPNVYRKYGEVVATAHVGSSETNSTLGMVLTLIRATSSFPSIAEEREKKVIWATQGGTDVATRHTIKFMDLATGSTPNPTVRTMDVENGQFLLGVSFAAGDSGQAAITTLNGTNVDIAVSLPFNSTGSAGYVTDAFFRYDSMSGVSPVLKPVPYGLSGNMFATYSADINLNYVNALTISEDLLRQLQALNVAFNDTHESNEELLFPQYLKEYLYLLADEGRLPTRAEIAMRDGNFREALRIFRSD